MKIDIRRTSTEEEIHTSQDESTMSLIKALQVRVSMLEDNSAISKKAKHSPSLKETAVKSDVTFHQVLMIPAEDQKLDIRTFSEIARKKLPYIPIKKLGITSQGHGFIKLPDKSVCEKALNSLKGEYNVVSQSTEQREFFPKITIYDLNSDDYTNKNKGDLKTAILNKNPLIKSILTEEKSFDVLFLTKDKARNTSKAVVKLHPDILKVIQKAKYKIFIDFGICRVSDRFFVKQCYKCQKFGHRSENCPADQPICRFCAANHESSSCTLRISKDKSKLHCSNCDGNHCTSDVSCPAIRKQVDYIISRTKGMETCAKNSIPPYAIVT
jgi:hypothetical protein